MLDRIGRGEELEQGLRTIFSTSAPVSAAPSFKHDKTADGWELIENTTRKIVPLSELEFVGFLKEGESYINGEVMVERAKAEDAIFGQSQAEYMLEHQGEIPTEFRGKYIPFAGTIWRLHDDRRFVPCLFWDGNRWYLSFSWLGRGHWVRDALLPRPRR